MIDDKQAIMLPVGKDREWQTIDLEDLVNAVYRLSNSKDESGSHACFGQFLYSNLRKENQTIFELTMPDNFTSSELARSAGQGLQRDNLRFEHAKAHDIIQYLERIHHDNRFKERPTAAPFSSSSSSPSPSPSHSPSDTTTDQPSTFPLGRYLHKGVIKSLVEWWQLVDEGYTIKPTSQLEHAIGKKPRSIQTFFEANRDQFRRLR